MKDPEFIDLKNRFLKGLGIIILFLIPSFFVIRNKLLVPTSSILKVIREEESSFVFVTRNKCKECKKAEKIIKKEIEYLVLNQDTDNNYQRILRKLNLTSEEITPPSIIYIEEGKVKSILVINDEEELELYIENNRR